MIADLLKTPQQVRQEQLDKLRKQGKASAAMLTGTGFGKGARTSVPSIIGSMAESAAATLPVDANQMVRRGLLGLSGLSTAVGATDIAAGLQEAAMSPEEREAQALNEIAKVLTSEDTGELKKAAKRAEDMNRPDVALKLQERLVKVENSKTKATLAAALSKKDPMVAKAFLAGELTYDQSLKYAGDQTDYKNISNYRDPNTDAVFLGGVKNGKVYRLDNEDLVPSAIAVSKQAFEGKAAPTPNKFTTKQLDAAFASLDKETKAALEEKAGYEWNIFGLEFNSKDEELEYLKEQVKYVANELRKDKSGLYAEPRAALKEAIRRATGGAIKADQNDPYAGKVQ